MINSIDHIVLTVKDINKTIDFYCNLLGMKYEEFRINNNSEVRKCLKFGAQKINLHAYDNIIKKMQSMKGLRFIISCDSIYKYNDYQRWGSKFEDIIANAITLKKTFSNINHFMFLNVYSLLNLNTYNISKKWFLNNGFKSKLDTNKSAGSGWPGFSFLNFKYSFKLFFFLSNNILGLISKPPLAI